MTTIEGARIFNLARFMNTRDHAESGTVEWDDLDLAGQESYLKDARLTIEALRLIDAALAPPTDVEREALEAIWTNHVMTSWNGGSGCTCGEVNPDLTRNLVVWYDGHILDAILASNVWRNHRSGPITDEDLIVAVIEDLEANANVIHVNDNEAYSGDGDWPALTKFIELADVEDGLRAALEAARNA